MQQNAPNAAQKKYFLTIKRSDKMETIFSTFAQHKQVNSADFGKKLFSKPMKKEKPASEQHRPCFVRTFDLVLRRECYGGIIFNRANGATVEVDNELFQVLNFLEKPKNFEEIEKQVNNFCKKRHASLKIAYLLKELIEYGLIKMFYGIRKESGTENASAKFVETVCKDFLSAPEVVHLSVTSKCNLNCPFCYEKSEKMEMTTEQLFGLIDELAEMRVFQLAIGGGEPLLRKDILKIIQHCCEKGIVPNLTTNGLLLSKRIMNQLSGKVGQINISLNNHLIDNNIFDISKVQDLKAYGIRVGLNFLATSGRIQFMEGFLSKLDKTLITNVIILRPKPTPLNMKWFEKNKLTSKDIKLLDDMFRRLNAKIDLHVDCSLVFLMRKISKEFLQSKAVYGCVAGERFCTIKSNGDVFPCSFLTTKAFLAGNVLDTPFSSIWNNSVIFKNMRSIKNNVMGVCRNCLIKKNCGGCRALALFETGNLYAEEKFCPVMTLSG